MTTYTLKLFAGENAEIHVVLHGEKADTSDAFPIAFDALLDYKFEYGDIISEEYLYSTMKT